VGRQVFYATARDLKLLSAELRKKGALFIAKRAPTPLPEVSRTPPTVEGRIAALLVREADLAGLHPHRNMNFGYWDFDAIFKDKPTVEFSGSGMTEGSVLRTGRLWYAPMTFGGPSVDI
jgi:hypothetical protein